MDIFFSSLLYFFIYLMIDKLITCLIAMICNLISHSCETRLYDKKSTTLMWWSLCSVRLSQVCFISSTGWRPTTVSDICFCSQIAKLLARLLWSMAYCHTTLISYILICVSVTQCLRVSFCWCKLDIGKISVHTTYWFCTAFF